MSKGKGRRKARDGKRRHRQRVAPSNPMETLAHMSLALLCGSTKFLCWPNCSAVSASLCVPVCFSVCLLCICVCLCACVSLCLSMSLHYLVVHSSPLPLSSCLTCLPFSLCHHSFPCLLVFPVIHTLSISHCLSPSRSLCLPCLCLCLCHCLCHCVMSLSIGVYLSPLS